MAKKMGRPTKFTQELADTICRRISLGESLRSVCRDDGMPNKITILDWLNKKPDFSAQYAKARQLLTEHWAEELVEIADDGTNDYVERAQKNGEVQVVFDSEHVNRSRLRVDTRKWLMSRLAPKKWGEGSSIGIATKDGEGLVININPAKKD